MNFLDEFQSMVSKSPDKAALVDFNGDRVTTYQELDTLGRRVAAKLGQAGNVTGKAVMVCMGRRMEYTAAEIGILMSGAAFVPVLPEYPSERLRFIEEDCQAAAVIDENWMADIQTYAPVEPVPVADQNRAMITYTSGSTGKPKGIVHSMASLTQGAHRNRMALDISEDEILGATAPLSFVVLVFEYFGVLSCGACVHMLPEEARKDVHLMEDYFAGHGITCAFISPQLLRFFRKKGNSLKKVMTGSERVSRLAGDGFTLYNTYGCSESAAAVAAYQIDEAMENTPIGKPLGELQFFLLDEDGREVPEGEEGELCIKGIVADGYLNLEEKTAQTFVRQEDGSVLLHTGDMAKRLPDGNYLYVNRKDWMVKINGQRVETGEIELRMTAMPEIENAVVKAFEDENGQNYLCAYYVSKHEFASEQIRTWLLEWLPGYMVPRFFKQLDSLPKNANGKLDRTALLPPGMEEYKAAYRAPESGMERHICQGFEEVLHCGTVGLDDDFFMLGGDSINVLKLVQYLEQPALTPGTVLTGRTPAKIAALLRAADKAQEDMAAAADKDRTQYTLTDSQMGVYLECVEFPESTMYNIPMCCELPQNLDRENFKRAVQKAVAMHPAFGVNIALSEGTPVMRLHPEYLNAELAEQRTDDIETAKKAFVRPFCMEGEPLYRMALYQDKNRSYFLIDVHHIIFDGTSLKVFLEEVSKFYRGEEPQPEMVSLMDLAVYEETLAQTPQYREARNYFAKKLGDEDYGEALIKDFRNREAGVLSREVKLALDDALSCMAVEQFVRQKRISENTLFLGAFSYALGKYGGERKSLFCTVNNGRHQADMAESVGMFVRTLPVCQSWEEETSVDTYLQGFQQDFYELMGHDCISFAELARDYGITSDILFVYQGEMFSGLTIGGRQYAAQVIPTGDVQADVSVMVTKSRQGYEVSLEYRKDVYREETARGLLGMYVQVLRGMLSCDKLGQIALTSELDIQILDRFNQTECEFDRRKTIIDLFREQAQKTPENTAVVYKDRRYTYAAVDEVTDRLAAYVSGLGIGREQVVSVLIPRCEYMPIASIGVSKAGAAYQPLDPTYPKERLAFMLEDADAKLLIADETLLDLVPDWHGQVLLTKDIFGLPKAERRPEPPRPEDLFILLYTSGSTGLPKGCMLEHRNLAAFCQWYIAYYHLTEESHVAAYASYGFDANMMDTYPALLCGGQVHIIEEAIRLDLSALNQYFNEQNVTHAFMTTQIGRAFATSMENHSLQYLSMGGETLTPFAPNENARYFNVYGPTECTILTTTYPMLQYEEEFPIGKPLSNIKLYIIDSQGRRVPVGVPGELCVSGRQVSRGYLNRPEKTKEVYSKNPFSSLEEYSRMYHTGDIVRYLPDGNIQFIGRRDGQVKIRGFRIELTEVEEIIRRFPGITDATVAAFDDPAGGKYIAAYVVSENTVDVDALNAFIEESKPPYMVPAVTMQIDKIPLNQNQKVNKRALPVPERKQEELIPPQNDVQQKIFDCVAEVVGHQEFGVTTDIYKAGLTSIGAVKLNVLLSDAFEGAVIRNKDLKENNTVERLEQFLQEHGQGEQFEKQEFYPLTQTQNGIFVECAANIGSTIYNIPFLFRLGEQVDLQRLKQAIEAAVEAHPYIKTTLCLDDNGDILQKRNDELPVEIAIHKELDRKALVRPYQLLGDQLFRIQLYDTPEGKYLFMEFHHIISDGESCGIFLRDINQAYGGNALSKETFSGYEQALVEQKALQGSEYARAKQYYDSVFAGCDTDFLPARDYKKGSQEDAPGVGVYQRSEQTDLNALQQFCTERKITLNTLFTAAFGFVTGRYVYKDEAVFTTIYNGRNDSRLSSTVNMLVKTLPVYCNLEGDKEIAAYLRETGEQLINSMNADIYSFAEISHAYNIKADILFAFQGDNFRFGEIAGEAAVSEQLFLDTAKAPLSIDVVIDKENGSVSYQVEYRSDMYEERTIAGIIDSLIMTVQQFQEKRKLREVCMVSAKAHSEIAGYNETEHAVEQTTANKLFERQAALYPDKTAVIACGKSLTFRELNENANKIANHLLGEGLKLEQMVGVMLPRTVDVYAARQGILKAGGAFLPIDPEYPDERISYILEDSKAECILMTQTVAQEHKLLLQKLTDQMQIKVLMVEELLAKEGGTENPNVDIRPENLCYCIYTSGSTGKPKGVMIEHRNLVNYVDDNPYNVEAQAYVYNATCSLAFAAITFDVSILEECIPLYHGITVCMANEEEIHNPFALSKLILENGVDMMTCTPSFLINIIDMPEMKKALSGIKVFNVGAEAFPEALYEKIRALGTDALIYNGYGPTETTIGCAFDQVTGDKITIGKPMANIKMVMIDKNRNLLPAGVPGELLIIGNGVGRGYVGKPELTADKFIQFEGQNAYRSGDLARWNHHGKIEFMGRMDNQVKLRGLRVELDEIENVINQYPTVKSSVVLVKEKDANQFLCGYFVAGSTVEKEKLTCFMQKYLTPYMVPSVLMQLPELPLTNNGKVDKRALPEPEYTAENKNYVKPQTELQRKLCEIFEMALGVEQIGIEDDFFANGGTSLSASKVAMKCMSAGIQVSYAELFDHKTPLELERLIQTKQQGSAPVGKDTETVEKQGALERVLGRNTLENVDEVQSAAIGNVLLTGANGFLGAHILKNMIDHEDNIIYCLIRKGNSSSLEKKLKNMLMYYFGNPYEELFGSRIRVIEGDITDKDAVSMLGQYDFARVINCAACVKHFSADDTLEQVNYQGVLNLIGLCSRMERELIQISTVSIAGENVGGKFPEEKKLHESELFFGQSLSNKYIDTKFRAEKAVLEAVAAGMKGKVIRVGNLMSRVSDGEFQINSVTNGFMRTLRGYVALGKFPVSMLDAPAEFSPIDSTAEAIVRLAPVQGDFSVFHAYSSYLIQMADVIEQMNQSGIPVEVVSDAEFVKALSQALENEEKNELIAGLIAYASGDEDNSTVYIDADNHFTTKALYRLGFKWPMPDGTYLKHALEALETLGFFDGRL